MLLPGPVCITPPVCWDSSFRGRHSLKVDVVVVGDEERAEGGRKLATLPHEAVFISHVTVLLVCAVQPSADYRPGWRQFSLSINCIFIV